MKYAQIFLFIFMSLAATACTHEETSPVTPPVNSKSEHKLDPYFERKNAVWGTITANGKAKAGTKITVVKKNEPLEIQEDGKYLLRLSEEEYGPSPHELKFSIPGYKSVTHSVTIPEDGIELNVDLKPE